MGEHVDEIPAVPAIGAAWLTAALHRAGIGRHNAIVSVEVESIGTGQMGDNVRFRLAWREAGESLPVTVVGKFASASETSRATARSLNSYRQEVGFYRDLAGRLTIRVPRVHHVGWSDETHEFVLIMEDVAPARQGDQLAGCTAAEAEHVIDEAVGLHAPTWGRGLELSREIEWLNAPSPERVDLMELLFAHTWPGFAERYADRIAADDLAVGKAVADHYRALHTAVVDWAERHDAWAVTHGDFRLDNLLFGDGVASPRVTVVDWQTVGVGIGPADVAYFCGAGLLPEARAAQERSLVARYAHGLRAAGVDIGDDAAWDGYVLGSASGFVMALIASQIVERTARGDEMFVAMATRHAHQMRTVGLLGRLGIAVDAAGGGGP